MDKREKKILLCITGGIAVYKMCSFVNLLRKEGLFVRVAMTEAAIRFVPPLTFQSLTRELVYYDLFKPVSTAKIEHIEVADWCDLAIVSPATANTISKVAHGICDNFVTTAISALPEEKPVLFIPTMNCHMWENQIIQKNISLLKSLSTKSGSQKYIFLDPDYGDLACGYHGKGKIPDNNIILKKTLELLS